jgi:hypothetical protein
MYNFFFTIHKLIIAFYIPFKAAFEGEPTWSSVYFDFYLDLVFFLDIIITFNMPLYDQKSRLITDRKVISIKYLRTWFMIDLVICWPLSYWRKVSATWPNSKDDILNLIQLNYTSLPRYYKFLLILKILRIRRITELITFSLKKFQLSIQAQQIILTCFRLSFLLQLSCCLWRLTADFNIFGSKNWLRSADLADAPITEVYIASLYWAVVTCTTVGYGDIVPVNGFELAWGMLIIIVGVAVFSFVLGDLAS